MKVTSSQRLILMPRNLSWWVWAITALCLAAGLMGFPSGFYAAIMISAIQSVLSPVKKAENQNQPKIKTINQSMNALSTKPVLVHAALLLASTAPSNMAKTSRGRLQTSSLCRRLVRLAFSANPSLRWIDQQPHQNLTCFPELVSSSGERIFNAYWR